MPIVPLDGPGDARAGDFRNIADAELLHRRGLFVAEGRLVVERILRDRRWRVHSLLLSEAAHRALEQMLRPIEGTVPIYICEAADFLGITGYNIHRGCLALVARPASRSVDAVAADARTLVVLESVANADNVGGVFRNAAAFGADAVVLGPTTCDPLYRKAVRTSMGAALRVPFARCEDLQATLVLLRAHGFAIVALTPRGPAIDLATFARTARPHRLALVVGAEGAGLARATEECADYRVRIPMAPEIDSLNLATATGIALYSLST